MVVALKSPPVGPAGSFCALCCEDGPGLHPGRLEDGGPIFLFCERCDSEVTGPPVPASPPGLRWTGGRYFPLDQIEQNMSVRILRALRRFDYIPSSELSDALQIPSSIESRVEQNTYSVALSRLCREGYVEVKVVTCRPVKRSQSKRHTGLHQWNEYRITQLGRARLEWMLASTMAPIHEGRRASAQSPGSRPPGASANPPARPPEAARRAR